jgi:SAM-dependent methyltransferase
MTPEAAHPCPVCGSRDTKVFFEAVEMPAHIGILWPSREEALRCPKGDIRLSFCVACGFITNVMFDPARMEYSQAYDNSLLFSPFYREYARSSAMRLIERHDLRNKRVMEIGCGKGDFLALLCELGNNRGVGFDPSFEPARLDPGNTGRITVVRDFYSDKYGACEADLILCRYVFEHIPRPVPFLEALRRAIGGKGDTVVCFEVPDVSFILRDLSGWDIIYEHCSYFGRSSLARAFTAGGFAVRRLEESFDGQYLWIEAVPAEGAGPDAPEEAGGTAIAAEVSHFEAAFREKMDAWSRRLEEWKRAGRRTALWGAGAKGVGFLNMLRVRDRIACAVDINPHKRSMHIPGTGHRIVAPVDLVNDPPDAVVMMNRVYLDEIRSQLGSLGLSPELLPA